MEKYRKTTPEEWAEWRARHERFVELMRRNEARDKAARKTREQRERDAPKS